MKTLVIFYSQSGKTKLIAQTLAIHLNGETVRIRDLKAKKGTVNKLFSSINAFRESKTSISPANIDLTEYDMIYIGTPVWASNPTPAIITIIDNLNLRGKDVVLFASMTRSGGEPTIKRLEEKVKARGARVVETFSLKTKDKSAQQIVNDTEAVIERLDLKMYKG